ncbi:hypothetical protein Dda_4475 [Drechslerella dactyloides]|uniref:Rgp1-domain-containing protein n=1 Tax=Drechslerella dactyloides TaxID=74499 RepID=A0AAD6J166_DREDA|nr:hypothetical protein Dda_4475 [Drechslerella dactyloides]
MSSNIRVFVSFGDKAAVFAGEDIECTITFRNIAPAPGSQRSGSRSINGSIAENGPEHKGFSERRSKQPPLQLAAAEKSASARKQRPGSISISGGSRKHRPSLSLSTPNSARRLQQQQQSTPMGSPATTVRPMTATTQGSTVEAAAGNGVPGHKHKRSISIVSIGSDAAGDVQIRTPGRRSTPHSRSTSLSYAPKRSPMMIAFNGMPQSATLPSRKLSSTDRNSGPATHIIEESLTNFSFSAPRRSPTPRHAANGSLNRSFKFPPTPGTSSSSPGVAPRDSPKPGPRDSPKPGPRDTPRADGSYASDLLLPGVANIELVSPAEESNNSQSEFEHVPPSKVINSQIMNDDGTPRSSLDFYSLPNSTTDTLISDFDSQVNQKLLRHTQSHSRRPSLLSGNSSSTRAPEVLMMGYVQVQGSFILDGSLVQTGSFDEVKRKGIVGGQMGGGVVGIESRKTQSGFLGGLGWGNLSNGFGNGFGGGLTNGITNGITNGLGSLITGGNMSTIAEMKNIANSRSIPVLSTPQSILFVDLKLAPGESRSYTYTFTLPKQLPPTHRGKAIKVVYNIVIGTQRPGKGVQTPKVVEVPFRVFPHVNSGGGLHTYDLMNPIVLLKDEAKIKTLDETTTPLSIGPKSKPIKNRPNKPESSLDEFLQYAEKLLQTETSGGHSPGGHTGILSPSITMSRRNSFLVPEQPTAKEAIDFAVTKLQGRAGTSQVFGITRNGKQVANLSLARPAYKLGEAIIAVIDFSSAQIPCYHVNATLETHESVNPGLALRSSSSVYRVTRKVHAQHSETCLFSKRITFSPTIPQSGTPEFSTSGVSLSWSLRIEFISAHSWSNGSISSLSGDHSRRSSAPSQVNEMGEVVQGDYFYYQPQRGNEGVMERTQRDDRGQLFTAVQQVWCDSFDCSIPVKVYANDVGGPGGSGVHGGFVV